MTETPIPYVVLEEVPPTNCKFMAFTRDHDQDAALQTYVQKYGQQPANIIRDQHCLYLGPIPEE